MPRWTEGDSAPRAGPYTDSRQPQRSHDSHDDRHFDVAVQPFMPTAHPQPHTFIPHDGHYYAQPCANPYATAHQGWYSAPALGSDMMPPPHAAYNWGPFQPSYPAFYPAPPHQPAYPHPAPAQPGLGDHRDDTSVGGRDPYHGYQPPGDSYRGEGGGGGGMFRRDRWQAPPPQQQQQQQQRSGWASRRNRNGGGSRSPSPAPDGDYAHQPDQTGHAYYARQKDQFAAEANGGGAYAGPRNRRGPRHGRYSQKSRRFPSEYDEPTGASAGEDGPHGFGFGGIPNISGAPAYGPDGSYIPPERRQRRDLRTATVSPPTPTYLAAADLPSTSGSQDEGQSQQQQQQSEPVTLIMDLNHTLLCRAKRNRYASKMPVVRPYLSTFLTYICTTEPAPSLPDDQSDPSTQQAAARHRRRFDPIVYSSARAPNVLSMLAALNLIPFARLAALPFRATYEPSPEEGDVLRMVFTREMMGLSERDYHGDVETVKDLAKVWERLGWAGDGSKEGVAKEVGGGDAAAAQAEPGAEIEADAEPTVGDPQSTGTTDATPVEPAAPPKKLNKKAKLRRVTKRDTTGASRTLLLDDEAGKAAQQPFSHLPIAPFLLHPSEIPDPNGAAPPPPTDADAASNGAQSRAASPPLPSASAPRTPFYDSAAVALQVDSQHPPAHGKHLLATIWQLERLRFETNLAGALKGGALDRLRDEARQAVIARRKDDTEGTAAKAEPAEDGDGVADYEIEDEMAQRGVQVCRQLGIAVTREWAPDWRDTLLASRS